jgi:hypothetical protein
MLSRTKFNIAPTMPLDDSYNSGRSTALLAWHLGDLVPSQVFILD